MDVQRTRRHNLCRLVSALEQGGIEGAAEQAHLLGNLVTGKKLALLVLASHIDTLVARGLECSAGLPRSWMDKEHVGAPVPKMVIDHAHGMARLATDATDPVLSHPTDQLAHDEHKPKLAVCPLPGKVFAAPAAADVEPDHVAG